MIDNYSLKARVYPMLLMFLPFMVVALAYSYNASSAIKSIASIGGVAGLCFLFSQFGRDLGKKKEPHLWHSWGGAPSIQVLRRSNEIIDVHTKNRYHSNLMALCPIPDLDEMLVIHRKELGDDVYAAWCRFLINKTRDTKLFSLLFRENINYGFRRNLWGYKPLAISLILLVIVCWYFINVSIYEEYNPLSFPVQWAIANLLLLVLLVVWLLVINKAWVRVPAFAYAERLLEASDKLSER